VHDSAPPGFAAPSHDARRRPRTEDQTLPATALLRLLTTFASPARERGGLLTFFFHRVLAEPDPMMPGEMDARRFDAVLGWIGEQFRVMAPLAACEALKDGRLPSRAALVSFDDGYRDNHDVALPILLRHGMQAVFFVATGYLGDGVQFNDRLTEAFRVVPGPSFDAGWLGLGTLPVSTAETRLQALERVREAAKYLEPAARWACVERVEAACGATGRGLQRGRVMMTEAEVARLAAHGMEIGGHTVTHPILCAVDDGTAYREISKGRDALTAIVGSPPQLFSYPNGKSGADFDNRHAAMARRAGFAYAFTTERGVARRATDPMHLPRFMPWHADRRRFQLQALRVAAGIG
jgi:peptidoglycan/xylan/chitin deacetylase (PgdA/CDA1 family)